MTAPAGVPASTARGDLLVRMIDEIAANGIADRSLRQLAAALGTSHRMLIYHFGSRDGLLIAVVAAMEQQQADLLMRLEAELRPDESPAAIVRRLWQALRDPAMWPYERLFFELAGRALRDAPETAPMTTVIGAMLGPAVEFGRRAGLPEAQARASAQLGIAAIRGLLLDLLATGDVAGTDAALEQFATLWEASLAGTGPAVAALADAGPPSTG
jgi:AcrR family transcriptional regulator